VIWSRPGSPTANGPGRARRGERPARKPAASKPETILAALILALVISGCGGARPGAATAQPPAVPGAVTTGPDLSGVTLPDFEMPIIHGGISLPDRALTPGAVTTTDANDICEVKPHSTAPQLSATLQTAVYAEYGDTSPDALHKHTLDWLVPYDLGGAGVKANIWPAAIAGTGFYQKIQTDDILRQMVCRRQLTLGQAQEALEHNWYSAWLRYVVATGHI
jgi:hypothetical protein